MITIKFVTSSGCVECERARVILNEVRERYNDIEIKEIDVMNHKGLELLTKHSIMANPAIFVNEELFAVGPLDKEKLIKKIEKLLKS